MTISPHHTEQIQMKPYIIQLDRLIISDDVGKWCQIEYQGHKYGCPNYNNPKYPRCPPLAPKVNEVFDFSKPLYFVHSEFDLEADIERRKKMTPGQTERQYRCVLYWQESSRKQMRERAKIAMWSLGLNEMTACPEGLGVNVYATGKIHGLTYDRIRNLKICRHTALIGMRKSL